MKKAALVSLLILAFLGALTVCALAAEEDGAFEPIVLADDDSVKVVLTGLTSSPEDRAASFTLEIENKTDMGLDFSVDPLSANDRLCAPSWVDASEAPFDDEEAVEIPAGGTGTITAGWEMRDLAQVGVNYVEKADGFVSAKWSLDYYMERRDEVGDDFDAQMQLDSEYYNFEMRAPFSIAFPQADMDVPATEEVIYDTDFEPFVIVDDENVTAIIHAFYFDHDHREYSDEEIGPSMVISFENRTDATLDLDMQGHIDGNATYARTHLLPPGKSLVETVVFSTWNENGSVTLTSANSLDMFFAIYDNETAIVYGNYYTGGGSLPEMTLDLSACADAAPCVYGTAAWVENPLPEPTPEPTPDLSVEEEPSDAAPREPVWVPDPEDDRVASVMLGENGEYKLSMIYGEEILYGSQALLLYFENISGDSIQCYPGNVMVNGSPYPDEEYSGFSYFSSPVPIPQGSGMNYGLTEDMAPLPENGFDLTFDVDFVSADNQFLSAESLSVTVSETGEITIN